MAKEVQKLSSLSWKVKTRTFVASVLDGIFPPVCAICKKVGTRFCHECRNQIQWIHDPICQVCGQIVPAKVVICHQCQSRPLPLKQMRAAVIFAQPVSTMIHKMKYEGMFGLAAPLVDLMLDAWPCWQTPVDIIVPIPLHTDRQKHRGYNQAALLGRQLSEQLNRDYADHFLRRTRDTLPQVGLNAAERLTNMQDAFSVDIKAVMQKKVLLVDDVCTTGATMTAAALALLEAGAASVSGYCVARAM